MSISKKRRGFGLTAGALALAMVATGCASSQRADDGSGAEEGPAVAYISGHISDFIQAQIAGMERGAEEQGGTLEVFDAEDSSAESQDKICQDLIAARRFDAFLIDPANGQTLQYCAAEAIASGIEVVSVYTPLGADPKKTDIQVEGQAGAVVFDFEEYYTDSFGNVVKACEGIDPCKVIAVLGFRGWGPDLIRAETWTSLAEKEPNIQIVAWGEDNYDSTTAVANGMDILRSNPDANVYAASGDTTAVAIFPVLEELGMADGVSVLGDGASKRGLEAIKSGQMIGTIAMYPQEIGYQAYLIAADAVSGSVKDPVRPAHQVHPDWPRSITAENADLIVPEW